MGRNLLEFEFPAKMVKTVKFRSETVFSSKDLVLNQTPFEHIIMLLAFCVMNERQKLSKVHAL